MRKFIVLGLVAACASDPAPPSCQQAFGHYYAAGCSYHDVNNAQITESTMVVDCQQLASTAPSQSCLNALNAWLVCNDDVVSPATTNAQCDCSQTQMAVLTCH